MKEKPKDFQMDLVFWLVKTIRKLKLAYIFWKVLSKQQC